MKAADEEAKISPDQAGTGDSVVNVVCVGFGAIGAPIVNALIDAEDVAVVAVVDPKRQGETVASMRVLSNLTDWSERDADVAVLMTGSTVGRIARQVQELVSLDLDVVSTSEELTYPWLRDASRARVIDHVAKRHGRTVVATGVNPGFIMDVLPVILAGSTLNPRTISVRRSADLERRRPRLREKLGVGLDVNSWERNHGTEDFGHVGLLESAYLCALGLGGEPDDATFQREPLLSGTTVIGVREVAELRIFGDRSIKLELLFTVGSSDEDVIEVEGDPPLRVVFDGGLHGDEATVARVLHTVRVVSGMPAGLRLPLEIPAWVSASRARVHHE